MKHLPHTLFAFLLLLIVVPVLAQEQPTPHDPVSANIEAVENGLLPAIMIAGQDVAMSLSDRMAYYNVPGVSIVVINDYEVEWARGYGVIDTDSQRPVTEETLFQAASISKPIAATAVLRLVQDGRIDLDTDVNEYLTSWTIPVSALTANQPVTLRRLLSHTAGTTVSGFAGYAVGEALPTALQILNGDSPANSAPVIVDLVPGTQWRYSGGGYTIIQQLVEDVTGQAFPDALRTLVLDPAGMINSTFAQPLPVGLQANAASAHDLEGNPIEGQWHIYPELAAAGLWTTPTDLARWTIAIELAYQGQSEPLLSQGTVIEMLTEQMEVWGLGVAVGGSDEWVWFAHSGSNVGFQTNLVGFMVTLGRGARCLLTCWHGAALHDTGTMLAAIVARELAIPTMITFVCKRRQAAFLHDRQTRLHRVGTHHFQQNSLDAD